MHYALPQRKSSSKVPAYAIKPNKSAFQLRRIRPQFIAIIFLGALTLFYLLFRLFGHSRSGMPILSSTGILTGGGSHVVIVTAFKDGEHDPIREQVSKNREDYAKRHGYEVFLPMASNYSIKPAPMSWAKVPAMRHAMTLFPRAKYLFYLDPQALIMNMNINIISHIMEPSRLESLMVSGVPIVPPDSVIKTFAGLKGDRVDFVLTQDKDGLSEKSFILRTGDWAKYLLDAWFDPLYRSYNFQRAERHALEHIIQWHGTILAKLSLVPQNIMNAYHQSVANTAQSNGVYKKGDFILDFGDCDDGQKKCLTEMSPYFS